MKGEGFIMNITDVRVRRVAKEGKMKAVVSIRDIAHPINSENT